MTTVAVLPVKRFADAKSRLDGTLTPGQRRALTEAMVTDVLIALRRTPAIDDVLVVTGDVNAAALATGYGASVVHDPDDAGHNEAARLGINKAIGSHNADRVLLLPGDCPVIDPVELNLLLGEAPPAPSVVIVPDRHGEGTNALLLAPPDVMDCSFGPGSQARHKQAAADAGAQCVIAPLASLVLDIDTGGDLAELRQTLGTQLGGAAHARGLLSRMAAL
jgi:2-phospho-L-lactate guanylyltransferase